MSAATTYARIFTHAKTPVSEMRFITHAHAREKLLSGVARFPRTAAGRSLLREAYELSFMRRRTDCEPIHALDWDHLAILLAAALAKGDK